VNVSQLRLRSEKFDDDDDDDDNNNNNNANTTRCTVKIPHEKEIFRKYVRLNNKLYSKR
jgi:hypothetical protein